MTTCRNHVDRPAVIVFTKKNSQFGYCGQCSKLRKGRWVQALVMGHGYTANRVERNE